MNAYSLVAMAFSIVGQIGVTYQKIWGLVVWLFSNAIWIYVSVFHHKDYSQLFMYCYFTVMNIYAIVIWKRNAKLRS